ncbi:MAG: hypothetical protein ABII22_04575 [Candidatus Micrarchaeota archaeon]
MKIITGNLISPSIIQSMLRQIPCRDLKQLKAIIIMLHPQKKERRRYGYGDYCYEKRTARVFLWSIKEKIEKYLVHDNNYYHAFLREIALTLYHEIGHHVHYIQGNGRLLSQKHDKIGKRAGSHSPNAWKLHSQMYEISRKIEHYADDYMNAHISNYQPIIPSFRKIKFIKTFRERWIDLQMKNLRENSIFSYHAISAIEHLRKCKLSRQALYSVSEICERSGMYSYHDKKLWKKYRSKIKKQCRNSKKPLTYFSRHGMKFEYYTASQADQLSNNPAIKGIAEEYCRIAETRTKA